MNIVRGYTIRKLNVGTLYNYIYTKLVSFFEGPAIEYR